jgi:hypothetical protein
MNVDEEVLLFIPEPRFRSLDQQALERKVDQFDRPDVLALFQLGSGIERNTFETTSIGGVLAHGAILMKVR